MAPAKKPKRLKGIETRTDSRGDARHRGTAMVGGELRRGPWSTDVDTAISWRTQTLRDAEDGLLSERRLTLGEAIAEFTDGIEGGWIRSKKDEPYRPGVVRLYKGRLAVAKKALGAKTPLDQLRLPHIKRFKTKLNRSVSDATARNTVVAIRALYAWACQMGYATINPCAGLPLPVGDKRVKRVAAVDAASLLTTALTGRDRVAFALAWLAGLRAGELLGLWWTPAPDGEDERSWVDLEARWIYVRTAIDLITRAWIDPKTYAGVRKVPIRGQLLAILEDYAEQGTCGLLFPADRVPAGLDRDATPMAYTSLWQRLQARWTDAGLERLELHEGRHTFVSMLIASGADAKKVMEYAGHASINVTYDLYGHLFPEDDAAMLRMLDDYDQRGDGS